MQKKTRRKYTLQVDEMWLKACHNKMTNFVQVAVVWFMAHLSLFIAFLTET